MLLGPFFEVGGRSQFSKRARDLLEEVITVRDSETSSEIQLCIHLIIRISTHPSVESCILPFIELPSTTILDLTRLGSSFRIQSFFILLA